LCGCADGDTCAYSYSDCNSDADEYAYAYTDTDYDYDSDSYRRSDVDSYSNSDCWFYSHCYADTYSDGCRLCYQRHRKLLWWAILTEFYTNFWKRFRNCYLPLVLECRAVGNVLGRSSRFAQHVNGLVHLYGLWSCRQSYNCDGFTDQFDDS
jgi:hypothetical protein